MKTIFFCFLYFLQKSLKTRDKLKIKTENGEGGGEIVNEP